MYREETTADGERVGQYSYIDQAGKTITVRYTAGKDGFRILEGDHVPTGANGQASAQFVATPAPALVLTRGGGGGSILPLRLYYSDDDCSCSSYRYCCWYC